MTESELRNMVADTAIEYLGCNEADGSHRAIIDAYNSITPRPRGYKMSYRDPWCAAFVSAVGADCGMTDLLLPECSCEGMIALYREKGLWMEADDYSPKVGDLILYDWDDTGQGNNTGVSDHIGIVYATDGKSLTVIEGNLNDAVEARTIALNARYIRGYCLPDYAGAGGKKADTPPAARKAVRSIRLGMTGYDVMAMQALLEYQGCSTGPDGPDGDFGGNTATALERFQHAHGLEADCVCGDHTWSTLLGKQEE